MEVIVLTIPTDQGRKRGLNLTYKTIKRRHVSHRIFSTGESQVLFLAHPLCYLNYAMKEKKLRYPFAPVKSTSEKEDYDNSMKTDNST